MEFGLPQLGLAILKLPPSLVPGGLAFLQLAAGGGYLLYAVRNQRLIIPQLGHTVGIFFLAVLVFPLAILQLLAAICQFPGGVGQFLVRLGLGVIVFGPGVVQFSAGLRQNTVVSGLAAQIFYPFHPLCQGVHRGLVVLLQAEEIPRTGGSKVDLGISLIGERFRQDVEHQADGAVADAGRFPFKAEIVHVMDGTHHRELGDGQLLVQILVIVPHQEGGADGEGPVHLIGAGLHHALAGGSRQTALHQGQPVDAVLGRKAVGAGYHGIRLPRLYQQVGGVGGLHRLHSLHGGQRRRILVGQAQGGENP